MIKGKDIANLFSVGSYLYLHTKQIDMNNNILSSSTSLYFAPSFGLCIWLNIKRPWLKDDMLTKYTTTKQACNAYILFIYMANLYIV